MGKDAISIRMKKFYEERSRTYLTRRTYTIIRLDGKSFSNWTKVNKLKKPFDDGFIEDMDSTAIYLCQNIQGAKLAFVQSDEITIVLTDFDTLTTDAWFDGEVQKMTSISASIATSKFNQLRLARKCSESDNTLTLEDVNNYKIAQFDSRVFTIPNRLEVKNCLQWRQQDTVRNSISSLAQSLYSHSELNNKNQSDMQEMCFQKGVNWNDLPLKQKNGRLIVRQGVTMISDEGIRGIQPVEYTRNKWVSLGAPTFTKDTTLFDEFIK